MTTAPPMRGPIDDPDWARLLVKARRSLERTGGSLDAMVSLPAPMDGERHVVIGITGVHRSASAARVAVRLADVDVHLRQTSGLGLVEKSGSHRSSGALT